MKPVKRTNPASNLWSPARRVWYQKNDDSKLGKCPKHGSDLDYYHGICPACQTESIRRVQKQIEREEGSRKK